MTKGNAIAEFDGLELRPVCEETDRAALEEWIAADPAHASILGPEFFLGLKATNSGELEPDSRATCYALEDDEGTIFYIRLSRAARVNIQFPPDREVRLSPRRTALALVKGMAFLEVALGRAGAEEWIFSSMSPKLRKLAERALGFSPSPGELVRPIAPLEPQEKLLSEVQQASERGA